MEFVLFVLGIIVAGLQAIFAITADTNEGVGELLRANELQFLQFLFGGT